MTLPSRRVAGLIGIAFSLSLVIFGNTPPAAAAPTTLTVGLVSKAANDWPLYIAQKTGVFAANGLSLDLVNTGSPVGTTQQLIGNSIDIGSDTSTQLAQAVQSGVTIFGLLQNTNKPMYSVIGKKGITSIADLSGKTVIVSSPHAITRLFMDTVLEKNGVKPSQVTFTYAGATSGRFAALLSGGVEAAILLPPFSFRAEGMGYPLLAEVQKYYPRFVFDTYVANTEWATSHRALAVAFDKSILEGVRYLYDPKNKASAIKILIDVTNTKPDDAAKTYDYLVTKLHAFSRTGSSTPADYKQVSDALVELGLAKSPMPPPTKFYDNSYVDAAAAQLKTSK